MKKSQEKSIEELRVIIETSNLFDKKFYLMNNRDVRVSHMTPIEHYIKYGIKEDRKPNEHFDPIWYREFYTDVKEDGEYPFLHYILFGQNENHFQNEQEKDEYEKLKSDGFDVEFYKNSYEDLKLEDEDFDFILHYVRYGKFEGRKIQKVPTKKAIIKKTEIVNYFKKGNYSEDEEKIIESGLFDQNYYLAINADIKRAECDPLSHYATKGWKEEDRRSPSPIYDIKKYLEIYQDIKKANVNPIVHYMTRGKEEGRHLFFTDEHINKLNNVLGVTVSNYKKYKQKRGKAENVIYFFNNDTQKKLSNPPLLNCEFDYVYFGVSGSEENVHTVWDYIPSDFYIDDMALMAHYYCCNINVLLPNYDNKVWIVESEYLKEKELKAIYYYTADSNFKMKIFGNIRTNNNASVINAFNDKYLVFNSKNDTKVIDTIEPNCLIVNKENRNDNLSVWWKLSIKYGINSVIPKTLCNTNKSCVIPEEKFNIRTEIDINYYVKDLQNEYFKLRKNKLPINKYAAKFEQMKVSVIIPVFNALEDVKQCLYSLETTTYTNYEVIIADDCSEFEVQEWLSQYAIKKDNIRVLKTVKNRGYTKNVNNAIDYSTADFIILLNSDTKVYGRWIEKLLIPFFHDKTVGVSGALSNAAGWQSVPNLRGDNTLPEHVNIEKVNRLLENVSDHPYYPASDIVNGFCMCIKKEVINKVGTFDEKSFPKGYGEEDDFCMRVRANGFKNVIATTVYVHHSKSKSFGHSTRVKLATQGREILDNKYGKTGYKLLTDSIGKNPAMNSKRAELQKYFQRYSVQYSIIGEQIAEIDTQNVLGQVSKCKICVHLHLHYSEMAKYFSLYLENVPYLFDLYISYNNSVDNKKIEEYFKDNKQIQNIVHAVYENRGRDVFPFIDMLQKVYHRYDYVLHIHSKKSIHNPLFGNQWLNHLMSHLLYSSEYVKNLLFIMKNENVGLLFPPVLEELYPNYKWGKNKQIVKELLTNIGVDISSFENDKLTFSAGNMFWADTKSLKKLFDYNFESTDFPSEPISIDGTLAHALERSLCFIVKDAGYNTTIAEPKNKIEFKNEVEMFKKETINFDAIEKTIKNKLKEKKPFSLVRYFDGEGAFYKAESWGNDFFQDRMRYYFGDGEYLLSDALFIRDYIMSSMHTADIVGIPNLDIVENMLEFNKIYADNKIENLPYIRRRYSTSVDCHSAWRILSSFQLVINSLNEDKKFCTKDIHYDMVLNGMIYRILDEVSTVSIINSQPVAQYIENLFGIRVTQYFVPARALDNDDFENTKHYPEAFENIVHKLKNKDLSGELFLIGAGPLGKAYCEIVKKSGGVALDMGAIFDSWINFHTRPEHVNESNNFNVKFLLTSENISLLTEGKVIPKNVVGISDLPKQKINKYIKS